MRYDLSLASETFAPAVKDFDASMLAMLDRMRKQGIREGSVTLKISVEIEKQFPVDEDGKRREMFLPSFSHETCSALTQKSKRSGEIAEDFVLVQGKNGLPELVSRDTDNLFDMVAEKEEQDEPDRAGDGA